MSDTPALEPAEKFYPTSVEAEPSKPTESAVTEVVDQVLPEGSEKLDKPAEAEKPAEESKATGDDETVQYLELDGKEHDLNEVRTWREGHLRQSDYTKKTQSLADERKTFKAESESGREALSKSQAEVTEMKDMLSVLVAEDDAVDWVDLKDKDPETYIELKEKADKRKAALEKVRAEQNVPVDDPATVATEQGKVFAANPDWLDGDKKITKAYTSDMDLMNKYAVNAGFQPEEYSHINRAHHLVTILKAAKWDEIQEKGRKIKAQRDKVPVITRPKATEVSTQPKSAVDIMYPPSKAG